MSLRNLFVVPVVFSALAFLAGCGGSGTPPPIPPPSGSFSNSNLNGTYVFSVSGIDASGGPYAAVGTFTANGSGGITGGALDINYPDAGALVGNQSVTGGNYKVNVDGRGTVTLSNAVVNGMTLAFVLQDSSHGMLTEFDTIATGSGTLDLQTAGVSAAGTYAFSLGGADYLSGTASFETVGNFTVGSGGTISGLQDLNVGEFAYPGEALSGSIALGPSSTPSTFFSPSGFGSQLTFDVIAIDASHLKFIEMDTFANLVGDAYSQTSTTIPQGTFAFTLAGSYPGAGGVSAAGGFMLTDGAGNIQSTSTADANNSGSLTQQPVIFSGTYAANGTGRYQMTLSGFTDGTLYAVYPFSGGWFLLEIDDGGIMSGAAFPQSQNVFNSAQGYGLNFTGVTPNCVAGSCEVDDIAEFTAASGATLTGIVDENFQPGGGPNLGLALSGNYQTPDSNGRGQIGATAGNNSNSTLNGGFDLTFYSVDGTTFPFIETDTGQVTVGTMFQQNPTASAAAAAAAKNHPFVVRLAPKARANWKKQK